MSKSISLIWLIKSLTKNEKKLFCIMSSGDKKGQTDKDYVTLFKIIEKKKDTTVEAIIKEYQRKCPQSSFNTTVSYLFESLVSTMAYAHRDNNNEVRLYNMLIKARILFEKSIYEECFSLIELIKKEATLLENNYVLLMAKRMELDFNAALGFIDMNETTLLNRQASISESIKKLQILNEQSSLYELLKYRIENRGVVRSPKQKNELNDLVISELSILSRSGSETSQIKKTHKLFQSYYLLSVGDYNSAINSFGELMNLLDSNSQLWNNSPVDYLLTTEGILKSLRTTKSYEGMKLFIQKLRDLDCSDYPLYFQLEVQCVTLLYTLSYLLDTGRFQEAMNEVSRNNENLYIKKNLLSFNRQIELSLYTCIVYFVHGDYKNALKQVRYTDISHKKLNFTPLYKTVRLLKLIIHYELGDIDYITSEGRSIQRSLSLELKNYKIEPLIFKVINQDIQSMSKTKRETMWKKIKPLVETIRMDKYEMQLLHPFDFTVWIESKLLKIPISVFLRNQMVKPTEI